MAFIPVTIRSTTAAQLQLGYDASNYTNFTTSSGGNLTIAPTGGLTNITGDLTVSDELVAQGDHHAIGVSSTRGYIGLRITNVFTSNGGSDFVLGVDCDPTITMATGDTNYCAYFGVAGFGITTQANEAIDTIAAARFADPQITLTGTASVTRAATVMIYNAPTEGANNAALWVRDGDTILGESSGTVMIGTKIKGSAIAGEAVLPNGRYLHGVLAAGNDTRSLIGLGTDDRTVLQLGSTLLHLNNPATVGTAGAASTYLRVTDGTTEYRIPLHAVS